MPVSLPPWLLWLAGALGLITAIVTIVQAIRVSQGGESESLGQLIGKVLSSAVVIVPLFAVLVTCGFCGWNAYNQNKDYTSKPQASFSVNQYFCAQPGHVYLHIQNPTEEDWKYAIAISDKDPGGTTWAKVPRFQSGPLVKGDALTIAVTVASNLCTKTGAYTQFAMQAQVTFTATTALPGTSPRTIVETPSLTIAPANNS